MNHDLSYLRSEYARNKDLECYEIEEKEAEAKRKKRTGRRMQAEMNFSLPRPEDLFKPGSQDYRLYERLLAAPITNAQIIDELRIFSYTRRLSDLREKGINVKATRVKESLFKYEIERN